MNLTFLGHQGWLVSDKGTHLLIDPILADRFGSAEAIEIFPPRTVDLERMPPLDALFLSHEHSDHIHLPSLDRLPRTLEVVIGTNMVSVVEDAISSLGFRVRRQNPFEPFQVGSITAVFYPAADDTVFWESRVNQFLLFPEDDPATNVFIAVDALVSPEYRAGLETGRTLPPQVICLSNNAQITPIGVFGSLDNLTDPRGAHAKDGLHGLKILQALLVDYLDGLPQAPHVLICGGGFMKGYPELGPFPFSDQKELARAATALSGRLSIHGPYPGDTFTLAGERLEESRAGWISLDESRFAALTQQSRTFIATGQGIDMLCMTDQPDLASHQVEATLEAALQEMVVPLMLSSLGQTMVSLKDYLSGPLGSCRMAVRCLAPTGTVACQWVLDVVKTQFVRCRQPETDADVLLRYPYGLMAYESDMFALVTGQLQIWDLAGVALRSWYLGPAEASPVAFLYAWFGEHLHPELYEASYRRKVEALGHIWRSGLEAPILVKPWN